MDAQTHGPAGPLPFGPVEEITEVRTRLAHLDYAAGLVMFRARIVTNFNRIAESHSERRREDTAPDDRRTWIQLCEDDAIARAKLRFDVEWGLPMPTLRDVDPAPPTATPGPRTQATPTPAPAPVEDDFDDFDLPPVFAPSPARANGLRGSADPGAGKTATAPAAAPQDTAQTMAARAGALMRQADECQDAPTAQAILKEALRAVNAKPPQIGASDYRMVRALLVERGHIS